MNAFEVRDYIEKYFGLDLSSKTRDEDIVGARAIYYKVLKEQLKHGVTAIGRSIGKDHACTINGLNKFEGYQESNLKVAECYHDLLVNLGVIKKVTKQDIKKLELSEPINKCVELLLLLTDDEVNDFIPRLEIYKKAAAYNRKKKKEWTRFTKQQA